MNTYYNNFKDRQEAHKKSEVKRERSFGEQMFPVVVAGTIAKGVIHVLSFCGGVILPAYGFDLLFGSFYIGLFLGFVMVFVFIELPKWSVVSTVSENYFDSNVISYGLSMLALLFIIPSILNSTYGVEIAVFWLSPDAELISIVDIENKHSKLETAAIARWQPQIDKHSTDAIKYFEAYKRWYPNEGKKGKYRLPTHKKTPWDKMDSAEKVAQTSLNSRLDTIQSKLESAVLFAANTNASTTYLHNFKKENAGSIAFWVMLGLEFSYVLIVFGLGYVAYRSEEERIGIELVRTSSEKVQPVHAKPTHIVPIQTSSNKTEQGGPPDKHKVVARNPIKFGNEKHGEIFKPQGAIASRVRYKKEDGSFVSYTKADLVRMERRPTGTEEYKDELNRLIKLF